MKIFDSIIDLATKTTPARLLGTEVLAATVLRSIMMVIIMVLADI